MGMRSRRWLAATCLMLAAAACSGDDDDAGGATLITDPPRSTSTTERSTTTTSTTTTIDPQADVKAEAEAAYLAYWDAWLQIFAAPSPENPLIEMHTAGDVLEATLDGVSQDILDGRSVHPPENPEDFRASVLNVDVEGDGASVLACLVDGSFVVDNATGEALTSGIGTLRIEAGLIRQNGLWKVATSTVVEEREGRWDCKS